jgi:hypothetical protein
MREQEEGMCIHRQCIIKYSSYHQRAILVEFRKIRWMTALCSDALALPPPCCKLIMVRSLMASRRNHEDVSNNFNIRPRSTIKSPGNISPSHNCVVLPNEVVTRSSALFCLLGEPKLGHVPHPFGGSSLSSNCPGWPGELLPLYSTTADERAHILVFTTTIHLDSFFFIVSFSRLVTPSSKAP